MTLVGPPAAVHWTMQANLTGRMSAPLPSVLCFSAAIHVHKLLSLFPSSNASKMHSNQASISVQVVHLTFLALQDQQSLLAMTSSGSLSSRRACQISTSTLTTFLSRAGSMVHPLGQAFGPLTGMRPNSSSHACRLASGCLVYVPNMPESL